MSPTGWIGKPVKRVEDARLLTGRGTYIDDHPPVANLHHAAIVRSPHAHARIAGYDLTAALEPDAPVLHDAVGTNLAGHRRLVYGDPDRAFGEADVVLKERFRFPKYGSTPIETYGVIAAWDSLEGVCTVWSNFMGPFIMHPLTARVLGLPENKLRFIVPPDIGGSFGIKTSIYPYIALLALAARRT